MDWLKRRRTALPLIVLTVALLATYVQGDVFDVQPSSVLTPERSTADVVFHCRAGKMITNPRYSWIRNNVLVNATDKTIYEIIVGDLYIHAPTRTNEGKFRCRVDSDQGTAISNEATLGFQYFVVPPTVTTETATRSQGQGLKIPCGDVPHGPEYSIYYMWENADTFARIPPQGLTGKYISQTDGTLYLANVQPSDSGTYVCTARTRWELDGQTKGANANKYTVSVGPTIASYDPTFMAEPADVTEVTLNGMTYLECFATGSPTPNITWTKDGSAVLPTSAKVSPSGQLAFSNVGEDVEGTYTCTASSSRGTISSRGRLQLKYEPRWVEEISSSAFDLDSDTTLNCSAKASPTASYVWYKNAAKLDTSIYNIKNAGGYSLLTLTNLKEEDAGIYQCNAVNEVGKSVSAANLEVRSYRPAIDPPVTSLTYAAFDRPVTIECPHTAAPAAEIVWEKDDVTLNSTRYEISANGSLYIRLVVMEDAGTYTCKVSNRLGEDESQGQLRVYEATVISTKPSDIETTAGQTVSMTCDATKDSAIEINWVWKHDGEEIEISFSEQHYVDHGKTLQIRDVQGQHNGLYTCCGVTKVGSPCASAQLYVTAPPDPPTDIRVTGSSDVAQTLTWVAGFDNYLPITSYHVEYKNMYSTHWVKAKTEPATLRNVTTCVVKGLYPYNDYSYRMSAANDEGVGDWSEPSSDFKTSKAAPSRAPSHLKGGGGTKGQLIVTWTPLEPEYYGSDQVRISYVVAVQKMYTEGIVIAEFINSNSSRQEIPKSAWKEVTVYGSATRNYTFSVRDDEVYAPYNVTIRAKNDMGDGPMSRARIVRTFELAPSTAPSNLRLGRVAPRAVEADLQWDALREENGRVQGYKVLVKAVGGPEAGNRYSLQTNGPGLTITVRGLTYNHVYTATIAGYNKAGTGPMSAPFEFNTAKKPPNVAPNEFDLSILNRTITARWSSIEDKVDDPEMAEFLGYKVEYWINGLTANTGMTFKTTGTEYTFNLPRGGNYNVWVKGYSAGGDGPPTAMKYVSTRLVVPGACCGAASIQFNSVIVMVVTLLWMLFIKLDL